MLPQLYTLRITHDDFGRRWVQPIDIVSDSIDKLREYARTIAMPADEDIMGRLPDDLSGMVWYIEYNDPDWRCRHTMLCIRVVTLDIV